MSNTGNTLLHLLQKYGKNEPLIILYKTKSFKLKMEQRIKEQVETFVAYGGYQPGMSVGEILDKSRSDRLVLKEAEKVMSGYINDLVKGTAKNTPISLPNINWQTAKYKKTSNAIEVANKIEQELSLY